MSSLLKKLFLTISILAILFSLSISPISASAGTFSQSLLEPGQSLEKFIAGEDLINPNGASGLISNVAYSLLVLTVGDKDKNGNTIVFGAVNSTANLIGQLYKNKPTSSTEYIAYVKQKINPVTPAYAQSAGWKFFSPMIEVWQVTRNVAYVFFIVIFVVVGFMVMFRSKLNPQTIINLQLALPKIIISLILVTFSYAISGLIIDFVYLANALIYSIYSSGQSIVSTLAENLSILNTLIGEEWGGVSVFSSIGDMVSPGGIGKLFKDLIDQGTGGIVSFLFPLIIAFTLFGISLKIFFMLLTKYVTLLLQGIFSPFVFLLAAVPNGKDSIAGFFRSMIAAALTFPAVYFLFELSSYIILDAEAGATLDFKQLPPLNTGGASLIGLYGLNKFIALGILMVIPSIPQAIDKALNVSPAATPDFSQVGGALRKIPIIGGLLG